ncbi:hypothetical protein FRC04_011287 [Tulasnella sp. 424]|nr:hypothetical protein FRC04_011287 [Tulasnella sp. 424]KAG8971825.1 hypothetical protein FRC05_010785 [Tulasnella sp. 425]
MAYIAKDLGDLLDTFQVPTSVTTPGDITDVNTLASYTWVAAPRPTIIVPGSPRIWVNAQRRIKVSPDRGYFNVDESAVRMGTTGSALTPIFAALDHLYPPKTNTSQPPSPDYRPPFDLRAVDVVCERNALRKLYRLANYDKKDRNGWRIDVEIVGKTCLFTSIQYAKTVFLKGNSGCGYGYEKASTTEAEVTGVETTQHHRITAFNFGSLKILLRYEVDACILPTPRPNPVQTPLEPRSKPKVSSPSPTFPMVSVIPLGDASSIVPQSSILEIKTRIREGEMNWSEIYPQLFLSQTPHLYVARHQQGLFTGTSVTKYDMTSSQLEKAAKAAEKPMARMYALLEAIVAAIRQEGEDVGMALTYDGKKLALHKRKPGTGREVGPQILARFKDEKT